MRVIFETLTVKTKDREALLDITQPIKKLLKKHEANNGQITLFVPHTTAAVTINENADPDVQSDMIYGLGKAFPDLIEFEHGEGNSDAHLKSSAIGVDQTILIKNGELTFGTWQGIYFCEFDGPRTRKCHVQILTD